MPFGGHTKLRYLYYSLLIDRILAHFATAGIDFKKKIFWVADHKASDLQAILGSLARKNIILNSIVRWRVAGVHDATSLLLYPEVPAWSEKLATY